MECATFYRFEYMPEMIKFYVKLMICNELQLIAETGTACTASTWVAYEVPVKGRDGGMFSGG
jgi:hypothetical protein